MKHWGLLVVFVLNVSIAAAQEAPIVRATIDPARVVVGQKATLRIDVLAPNYMTRPPVLPEFQLRNAVTRAEPSINMSERHGDTTLAGVRFEFSFYPQEPGSYAIPAQNLTVSYAAQPPASRDATVALAPLAFEAFIPDAAQALDPFVAAASLTVRQEVRRSSEALKVGDAVTRTVTLEAAGIPAMLLPPTVLAPVAGTQVYPAPPALQDHSDRRTGAVSATRIDEATYMLQRAGEVTLPAMEIGWWSTPDQKIERTRLKPVVLQVAAAPDAAVPAARPETSWRRSILFVIDHWIALVTALAAAAVLAWIVPRVGRDLHRRWMRRRAVYRASEAFAFAALRRAARRGDAAKTYAAMLDWVARFGSAAPDRTAASLMRAAHDPALAREVAALERVLFAPHGPAPAWSPRSFARRIAAARRALRRVARTRTDALPHALNPTAADMTQRRWRAVAR